LKPLAPFIIISFFNHPTSDDYCFIDLIREIGFVDFQYYIRNKWGGRYISYMLTSSGIMEEEYIYLYKFVPILLILTNIGALFFLVKSFFNLKSYLRTLNVVILIFLLYLAQLPIISEGFYWFSSSASYELGNILTILLLGSLVHVVRKSSIIYSLLGCILTFLLIGCNEVTMLLTDITLLIIGGFYYYRKRNINIGLLLIILVAIISTIIVITAPGNYLRGQRHPYAHMFITSIVKSSAQSIYSIMLWIGLSVFVSVLIYKELLFENVKDIIKNKINIDFRLLLITMFVIVCLGFFVGFWSTGEPLSHRARNVVYFFFTLTSLLFLIVGLDKISDFSLIKTRSYITHVCFILVFFLLVFGKKNINNCFVDLMKKKAVKYDAELKNRKRIIKETDENIDLILPPLSNIPKTIFVSDIKKQNNKLYNICYSKYWKINSVKVNCTE